MVTVKYRRRKNRKTRRRAISFYKKPPPLLNINGYYLLLLPLKKAASFRIDCNIFGGSALENKYNTGIAHILEHVLMGAWKKCGKQKCSLYLEKYGMVSNASTHLMNTSYWAKCLPAFSSIILNYMFDIIFHPKITQSLLDSERKIVKNELEGYINTPSWKLHNLITKEFYQTNGLRFSNDYKRQIEVLDNITLKSLENYMKHTRLKNCVMFTISGDFEREKIISYFRSKIQDLAPNRFKCQMSVFNPKRECFTLAKKVIFVHNPKAANTQIVISFPTNIKKRDKDSKLLPFVNRVIASDLTSLLVKRLREELNLVYGVSIYNIQNICGTTVTISISTLDSNITSVLYETFNVLKRYSKQLTPKNTLLHEKRKYALMSRQISERDPDIVSSFYSGQFFWQLPQKRRIIYTLGELHKAIKEINRQNIRRIIKKIFNTDHCIVGYIGKRKVNFNIANF